VDFPLARLESLHCSQQVVDDFILLLLLLFLQSPELILRHFLIVKFLVELGHK
jgi:hypothetical protein